MTFKKQFTGAQAIEAIRYNSDLATASKIAEYIGCSVQTIHNLLSALDKKGCVKYVNHGTDTRPAILWSRTAKAIQNSISTDERD